MNKMQIVELQEKLDYIFLNPALLENSMTHSSYANENVRRGMASNERLEFLGDSLLGMAVAMLIYKNKPELTEGQMTKLRAELVCEKSLAALASELNLGLYLLLGRGEENGGGRGRPSLLADAFEALLAAIYLDGGYEPVERVISAHFTSRMNYPVHKSTDYKTVLQEMVQVNPGQSIIYEKISEYGPDHNKSFTIGVKLNGKTVGTGTGKTKKSAEQEAARAAISILNK